MVRCLGWWAGLLRGIPMLSAKSLPPVDPKTDRIDHGAVAHIRNQVGTLRWLAVKLLPKR
jgi:hypothetical protein